MNLKMEKIIYKYASFLIQSNVMSNGHYKILSYDTLSVKNQLILYYETHFLKEPSL